jgi:hypothetical protein
VEGLHAVGGPQLKDKYPFLCSFTCCVFVYVVISMVLSVITACMLLLLFLH